MRFNKNQTAGRGIAKVADNLATACMVAAIVGGFVDSKIGWPTVTVLCLAFVVLAFVGVFLRQEGDDNGN